MSFVMRLKLEISGVVGRKISQDFQELTLLYQSWENKKLTSKKDMKPVFERILQILEDSDDQTDAQFILEDQAALIEQGQIQAHPLGNWFVAYYVPKALSKG